MKECKSCNEVFPLDNFYSNKKMKDGYLNRCKPCERESRREQQQEYWLQKRYGLSPAEYKAMFESQDWKCSICTEPLTDAVVDHCHDTGNTRALLCQGCNKALGFFKDNPELMERGAQYVREHRTKAEG